MNNWKKKFNYFILLPLVIGLWLLTFYRFKQMSSPIEKPGIKRQIAVIAKEKKDEVNLLLNYEDPFLNNVKKTKSNLQPENDATIEKSTSKISSVKQKINEKKVLCRILIHKNDYVITGYKDEGILKLETEK